MRYRIVDIPAEIIYCTIETKDYLSWDNWTLTNKSRFIESILLGLPMIPLIAFESPKKEKWELIDGRSRISTILQFVQGEFILQNLEIETSANNRNFTELSDRQKNRIIKKSAIKIFVIEDHFDPKIWDRYCGDR